MLPDELQDLLLTYEKRLLEPAVRRDPHAAGALLAEEFREFGSSGRVFDRQAVLSLLASEPLSSIPIAVITDFSLTRLAADTVLVTYKATQPSRCTLRSSLWVLREGRWLMLFHQGTLTDR